MRARYESIYASNQQTRKMQASTKSDSNASKRIGRYLLANPKRGICFHAGDPSFNPITYAYVDASLMEDSISGVAVYIGIPNFETHENLNGAVISFTKKETEKVTSTMHSEMICVERGIKTLDYATDTREESGFPPLGPSILFTDNTPGMKFLSGTGTAGNRQTRHLRRRVAWIKEALLQRRIVLRHVPSSLNCADLLTKGLGRVLHERHAKNLLGDPRDIKFPGHYYCGCTRLDDCVRCRGCVKHHCLCDKAKPQGAEPNEAVAGKSAIWGAAAKPAVS